MAAPDSQDQFRTKTNKLLISKLVKEDVVAPRQQQTELVPSVDPLFYEPGIETLEVSGRVRASLCSRRRSAISSFSLISMTKMLLPCVIKNSGLNSPHFGCSPFQAYSIESGILTSFSQAGRWIWRVGITDGNTDRRGAQRKYGVGAIQCGDPRFERADTAAAHWY